jgi:outer membrane receptor protein involved in Fe transport
MKNLTKTIALIFYVGIISLQVSAQQKGGPNLDPDINPENIILSGLVLEEESQEVLEFAAVSIFNSQDSSLAIGGVTDLDGRFSIEIKPGKYYAKIEYIGLETWLLAPIEIEKGQGTLDFGTIKLQSNAQMLAEVEVIAEKSTMQIGLDKKIFNVGKDLLNRGGNAADILDNIPSVTVDIEGQVSLRGSSNVRILVDGKQSGLVGIGSSKGLQSLQANMIEKVEIITNPSAKYDAEGMSGIINIILKKQQQQGFNGSVDASAGAPDLAGFGGNINYRKSNINFFTQYGFRYRGNPGGGSIFQEYFSDSGDNLFTDQTQERNRSQQSHTFRAGLDYFINDKNIITASGLYRYSESNNNNLTIYRDLNTNRELELLTNRSENELETEPQHEYNIRYKRTFDKKGRKFDLDLQYRDGSETENSDFFEDAFLSNGQPAGIEQLIQRSNNDEGESSFLISADFEEPIGKDGKFETGYRGSFRDINNKYLVETLADGEWERLDNQSNNFIYNEDIHAIYTTIGNKFNKFSVQAGLRYEFSDVRTFLVETDERNDRTYSNFFPSLFLGYELNKGNSIQISYSRRIRRPGFRWLNPFFSFSDARNIFSGNPNLDPQFTDSYELSFVKIFEKGTLSSSIYHRHTKNVIERIITIDEAGVTYRRPENLLTSNAYGAEFTYNFDLTKWWDVNGSANFYRKITNGGNLNEDFQADAISMTSRLTNLFDITQGIQIQSRFNYRAPERSPQGTRKAMIHTDLAVSFDVLQKNGTLNLSISDVFNSRKWRYTTFTGSSFIEGDFQWRSRQITLALNYRINQKKRRGQSNRRYEGGGEDMY